MTKADSQIFRLIEIMDRLRDPENGCPWDLEQDHKTLIPYLLEEAYEVKDAIENGDVDHMKEELGDLLLQIVFHARLAKEKSQFSMEDVARDVSEKMVRRHPHVFGDVRVDDAGEVLKNWEEIKAQEKKNQAKRESLLDEVPDYFPALIENYKISKKAAKKGFEWQKPIDVLDKVEEEIQEIREVISDKNPERLEEELGDLLFAVANTCRVYKINPELALSRANKKFRKRFAKMEEITKESNRKLEDLDFESWDLLWRKAKQYS